MDSTAFFLGRQPIVDRKQQLVAYELLFRSDARNSATVDNDVAASASVIQFAFGELGVARVLGPHLGFINLSESLLLSDTIELLPREQMVLELLETIEITDVIVDRCQELANAGYTLALDDVLDITPAHEAVLPYIRYVKLEILGQPRERIAATVAKLRRWPVQLLAEKIDSASDKIYCEQLGCQLFQGYYFARPTILSGTRRQSSESMLLQLLGQVMADADTADIENSLKLAPDLSVNLLRLVNSAAYSLPRHVDGLRAAINMLGRQQLQRWIQLLIFSRQSKGRAENDPLLLLAAGRGKLLEEVSLCIAPRDASLADSAFMTGMLSLVDVALSQPLPDILAQLPLAEPVKAALLHRQGRLGLLLQLAEASEHSDLASVKQLLPQLAGLDLERFNTSQVQALDWANRLTQSSA